MVEKRRLLLLAVLLLGAGPVSSISGQSLDSPNGMVGTQAGLKTLAILDRLPQFEGLSSEVPWRDIYVDPYCGVDTNDGSTPLCGFGGGVGPIRTIQEAKARSVYGARVRFRRGAVWSPLTFSYTTNLTGTCRVGETVTYNATLKARILAIDQSSNLVIFESLRPADPRTPFDDLDDANRPTGDLSGCAWGAGGLQGKVNTMGDYYAAGVNTSGVAADLRDRIVVLWETWPAPTTWPAALDTNQFARLSCDRVNAQRPYDPDGLLYSESTAPDSGFFGAQNLWIDGCALDVVSTDARGKVRVLNIRIDSLQPDSATGNSTGTAANVNCATIHGNGRVDVLNMACAHQGPWGRVTSGAPIALASEGGNSQFVLIGASIHHDVSLATSGNPAHVTSTGGSHVLIHSDAFIGAGALPTDGFIIKNNNANSRHVLALNVSRGNGIAGSSGIHIRDQDGVFTNIVRTYQNTLFNFYDNWTVDSSAASPQIALVARADAVSDPGRYMLRQVGTSSCSGIRVSLEGLYDDSGARWRCGGVDYSTAASARAGHCGVSCGWGIYGADSADTDGADVFVGDDLACDSVTPGACHRGLDQFWTIVFPHCLYDYLPIEICSLRGGGPNQNFGAR